MLQTLIYRLVLCCWHSTNVSNISSASASFITGSAPAITCPRICSMM